MVMKTNKKSSLKNADQNGEMENLYVTLPSTLNYANDVEDEEAGFGYPDFFEDTDNMNRYLW